MLGAVLLSLPLLPKLYSYRLMGERLDNFQGFVVSMLTLAWIQNIELSLLLQV